MIITLSGGYDKYSSESQLSSVIYRHRAEVQGLDLRKVGWVTLAKPDHYYDDLLTRAYGAMPLTITSVTESVDWSAYRMIVILGGDTIKLHAGLKKLEFGREVLDEDVHILGDSAGAYVMCSHYYDSKERLEDLTFHHGYALVPDTIAIAHTNSPRYVNDMLIEKVSDYADQYSLQVVELRENEEDSY